MTTSRPKRNTRNATPAPPVEDDATIIRTTLDRIIYTVDVIARFDQTRADIAAVHRGESNKTMAQVMAESRWHEQASKAKKECPLGSSKKKKSYEEEEEEEEEEDDPNVPSTSTKTPKSAKPTPEKKNTPSKAKLAAMKKKADAAKRKAQREAKKLEALGEKEDEDGEDDEQDETAAESSTAQSSVPTPEEPSTSVDSEAAVEPAASAGTSAAVSEEGSSSDPKEEETATASPASNSEDNNALEPTTDNANKQKQAMQGTVSDKVPDTEQSSCSVPDQKEEIPKKSIVEKAADNPTPHVEEQMPEEPAKVQPASIQEHEEVAKADVHQQPSTVQKERTDDKFQEEPVAPVDTVQDEPMEVEEHELMETDEPQPMEIDEPQPMEVDQEAVETPKPLEEEITQHCSEETAAQQPLQPAEKEVQDNVRSKIGEIEEKTEEKSKEAVQTSPVESIEKKPESSVAETSVQTEKIAPEVTTNFQQKEDVPEESVEVLDVNKPWLGNRVQLYPLNLVRVPEDVPGRIWYPLRGICNATSEQVVEIGPLTELETLDLSLSEESLLYLEPDKGELIIRRMLEIQIPSLQKKLLDPTMSAEDRKTNVEQLECYQNQFNEYIHKGETLRLKMLYLPGPPLESIPTIAESIEQYAEFDPTWYTSSRKWAEKRVPAQPHPLIGKILSKKMQHQFNREIIRNFELPLIYDLHRKPNPIRQRILKFREKLALTYQYEDFKRVHMTDPACREIWKNLQPMPFDKGMIVDEAEEELTALISTYKKQFAEENPVLPMPKPLDPSNETDVEVRCATERFLCDVIDTVVVRDLADTPTYPHRIPAFTPLPSQPGSSQN